MIFHDLLRRLYGSFHRAHDELYPPPHTDASNWSTILTRTPCLTRELLTWMRAFVALLGSRDHSFAYQPPRDTLDISEPAVAESALQLSICLREVSRVLALHIPSEPFPWSEIEVLTQEFWPHVEIVGTALFSAWCLTRAPGAPLSASPSIPLDVE